MRFEQTVPFIIPSLVILLAFHPESIALCIALIGACGLVASLKLIEGHRKEELEIIRAEIKPIKEKLEQLTIKSFNR